MVVTLPQPQICHVVMALLNTRQRYTQKVTLILYSKEHSMQTKQIKRFHHGTRRNHCSYHMQKRQNQHLG